MVRFLFLASDSSASSVPPVVNETFSPQRTQSTQSKNEHLLMPDFCDVAVPVPLDTVFTYRIPEGMAPVVGGRVLVPFRQQRMSGIVVALHDRKPSVQTKN